MSELLSSKRIGDVNHLLWWPAWHPLLTILLGFFVVGLPVWILSVLYVNWTYEAVLEEYEDLSGQVTESFMDQLEHDVDVFVLDASDPSYLGIKPGERYETTNLLAGPQSVTVFRGVELPMSSRVPQLHDASEEIYYDQVSAVSYSRPYLEIRTSDGGTLRYESSRRPEDALNTLQNRIRAYKG